MALPGELLGTGTVVCGDVCGDDCKEVLTCRVLQSGAGYYYGHFCPRCGPVSRESVYFQTKEIAQKALEKGSYKRTSAWRGY